VTVSFEHLLHLSDAVGTFEHADHEEPRREHGYCVDDVARVVIAACQESEPRSTDVELLLRRSLRFVIDSIDPAGRVRNRRDVAGRWTSEAGTGDWWGRALWSLGVASVRAPDLESRSAALATFTLCSRQTSTSPRALAFATLGASEVLGVHARHVGARRLIDSYVHWYASAERSPAWRWPEHRLAYANAVIADAVIAAGHRLDDLDLVRDGLDQLSWLLEIQTLGDHLSVVPVGGAAPGDVGPRFDQQPIEIARLADGCARAFDATYDPAWLEHLERCSEWFDGRNDLGVAMWDPSSGAGFDGLTRSGPNLNRGAESTLAAVTTRQAHLRLDELRRPRRPLHGE